MTATTPPFPLTSGMTRGYEPAAVDAFLSEARVAFESGEGLSSAQVRTHAFPLTRHGYDVARVDGALARLEEAFAARERQAAIGHGGVDSWVDSSRENAQEILDHLARPDGARFSRSGFFRHGYSRREVDLVADRVSRYLAIGEPLSVEQVRSVAFRTQRNGYSEAQVDALLDAVLEVMLAVR